MFMTATKTALVTALQYVEKVAERKNTIPILGNVLIETKGGSTRLTTTDMELAVTTELHTTSAQEGSTTVPVSLLYELVRRIPECTLEFTLGEDDLRIVAGKFSTNLRTLPAADFPLMNAGSFGATFEMPTDHLASMIKRCSFAMSTDETRYYLNGLYLHASSNDGENTLRGVATDGHRLARIDVPLPAGAAGVASIIVPRKGVKAISEVLDGTETVTVSVSETRLMVVTKNATLITKLIDGAFPEYERVIPRENGNVLSIDKKELAGVIGRVSAITTERAQPIALNMSQNALTVSLTSKEQGTAEETLDEGQVNYSDSPMEVGVQGRYVTDVIDHIPTVVQIRLADPNSPIVFTEQDKADALYVVMPLRL